MLQDDVLYYFSDRKAMAALGAIVLTGMVVSRATDGNRAHCFCIKDVWERCVAPRAHGMQMSVNRELILSADSEEDFDGWATALTEAACSLKGLSDDV